MKAQPTPTKPAPEAAWQRLRILYRASGRPA
jgi:hypothetical protein